MAAHYTPLRVERQDLFEDQFRANDTRSVRRASGLVLARHPTRTQRNRGREACGVLLQSGARPGEGQQDVSFATVSDAVTRLGEVEDLSRLPRSSLISGITISIL